MAYYRRDQYHEKRRTIRERIEKYTLERRLLRDLAGSDPEYLKREIENYQAAAAGKIAFLRHALVMAEPFAVNAKKYVPDVSEQTMQSALYLLFGRMTESWKALFILAENGFNPEIMGALRSIKEGADLARFFMLPESDDMLGRWFDGEVIKNRRAREAQHEYLNEETEYYGEQEIPLRQIKARAYGKLSEYTHVTYGSLVDSLDPLSGGFDFSRFAGYKALNEVSLPMADGVMGEFIMALREFYSLMGDEGAYGDLDAILKTVQPDLTDEEVEVALERFGR